MAIQDTAVATRKTVPLPLSAHQPLPYTGPSRDEAAMDLVVQGSSGLLSITGTEDGESVRCGYGVTDVTAGMFAAMGILLALRARESTGKGQLVDVSMLDCA